MHREISHADSTFTPETPLPLYLFTGLIAVLVGLDLYPQIAAWLGAPVSWSNQVFGYRFALIAAVLGGARVLYGSLQSLLDGRLGADLALAIACLAAILMNEPLVAAEVVFIGMLGECLEAFVFARTQNAIRKIVEFFPIRCWRLENGQETRVFTNQLQVGDHVVVKPGGKVPVDGVVLAGRSAVDVSALNGESLPLDKVPGDEILAGSLNQFGALTIEAKKVAEETVAGKVIEMTARALKDKTRGERIADRMARYFLPVVLGLATATFLVAFLYHTKFAATTLAGRSAVSRALYPTLSVLVVACPCALILATPAAIMAALARLAGTGVLVKSGRAFERLAEATAVAFDKTGTLTEGKLSIRAVRTLDFEADVLFRLAAIAEMPSEHPLGRAVVHEARSRGLTLESPTHFQAVAGGGVVADVGGANVVVGSRRLLAEHGIAWPPEADAIAAEIDDAGQTPLWVASNGRLLGALAAQDHARPEAAGILADLRAIGLAPIVLLTGDRRAAALAIGRDFGLADIAAELLPHQKAERIEALKQSGSKVAMIGDGINDAPALARSDVGLAIGGVDLAAEAGDVVLLGDPLAHLPLLFRLSRKTVQIIRQNILWFAFGVNLVGILLTAWLWPFFAPTRWADQSPLAAVIYHQIGSLAVLLNSMRILWFERAATNRTVLSVEHSLRRVDRWIDHAFDPHEWTHWLYERRKTVSFGCLLLVLSAWALSGLTLVKPDETAVVRRFGRPVETLTAGWHWRYPWPVEDAVRVSDRLRTVEIGFRENPESLGGGSWTWTSAHRKENRRADEATMITGDGNLVDVQAVVRFRVTDPRVYLFEVANVEEILRASAEATLRGLVAGRPFHDLLTVERDAFQAEILARLKQTCTSYGDKGLGVEIEGVSLIDLHPPGEVVESYYDVAKATEFRDKAVNDAERQATSRKKRAQSEAEKVVALANAAAAETTYAAAGDTLKFTERSKARKTLSAEQEIQLTLDGVEMALRGETDVDAKLAERRKKMIASQEALSDFRTFWDAIGAALQGRSMILVDSDQVRGQRNLFLIDPDLFRPVMPFFGRVPPTKEP